MKKVKAHMISRMTIKFSTIGLIAVTLATTLCSAEDGMDLEFVSQEFLGFTDTDSTDIENSTDQFISVANISEMLSLIPEDGMTINVNAFAIDNDGGGGIFQYHEAQSGINNGGTIIDGWVRQYTEALNAKWWGATGDGITDDQPAISAALHYAYDNNLDIFFPKGSYKFSTEEDYYGIKHGFVEDSSGKSFRLFGEIGTKFITSMDGSNGNFKLLGFYGSSTNNIIIEDIEFENTHGLTTNDVVAIYLQSSSGHKNMIIQNCHFHGWSTAISANGTKNLLIENNKFTAPLGHDNATNNSHPATYVRFNSNANGVNQDAILRNNYVEGYSGKDITTTTSKKAMDGFVYSAQDSGGCNGMVIERNTLLNLSEEAIAVSSYLYWDNDAEIRPIIIRNNYIDSTLPKGSTHNTNYGILADSPNTNIYGNTIKAAYGILVYPVSAPMQFKDISIHQNKIYLTKSTVNVLKAIFLAGYATGEMYPLRNVSVHNNDIYAIDIRLAEDTKLIHTANILNATIKDNNFFIENVILDGYDLNIYEFSQNCDNIEYGRESIHGSYTNLVVSLGSNTGITYIGTRD
ncbi:glycosyl hydrolase family 28-related protein [Bacteroidota bacterium]